MSDKPESKYFWADIGPDFDPDDSRNPNENCFTLCVLAADYDALARELDTVRVLLRKARPAVAAMMHATFGSNLPALAHIDAFLAETQEGER